MFTTYIKNDHKVMHFKFESITDYVNYLKTAEQQPVFNVQTSMITQRGLFGYEYS